LAVTVAADTRTGKSTSTSLSFASPLNVKVTAKVACQSYARIGRVHRVPSEPCAEAARRAVQTARRTRVRHLGGVAQLPRRSAFAESIAARRDIGGMASGEMVARSSTRPASLQATAKDGRSGPASRPPAPLHDRCPSSRRVWLVLGRPHERRRHRSTERSRGPHVNGVRFFERLYVDGLRTRFGADANWRQGPWHVTAEVLRVGHESWPRPQPTITPRRSRHPMLATPAWTGHSARACSSSFHEPTYDAAW
jgi:hypothetical protein